MGVKHKQTWATEVELGGEKWRGVEVTATSGGDVLLEFRPKEYSGNEGMRGFLMPQIFLIPAGAAREFGESILAVLGEAGL
jgi:hypothetical protein